MTTKSLKIYMAGPDVFYKDALDIAARKKEILNSHNFEGHHPFDNSVETQDRQPKEIAQTIFTENIAMMDRCDMIIANLTPFRGPSADVGTVFELGYMFSKNKPIFGYSNIDKDFITRTEEYNGTPLTKDDDGIYWDKDILMAENFDLRDNLMIDCSFVMQAQMIQKRTDFDGSLTTLRDFCASQVDKNKRQSDLTAFTAQVKNMAYLRDNKLLTI